MTDAEWPDLAASYDAVATEYAAAFADELAVKPFDRALLDEFAAATRGGPVLDVGCGSAGHVTRYLADQGADVSGTDLSAGCVEVARRRQPDLRFEVADMRELGIPAGSLAGIVAFYSVIHLPRQQVPVALAEFGRVLRPHGVLLLAVHGGTGEISSEEFLGLRSSGPASGRLRIWPRSSPPPDSTSCGSTSARRTRRSTRPSESTCGAHSRRRRLTEPVAGAWRRVS